MRRTQCIPLKRLLTNSRQRYARAEMCQSAPDLNGILASPMSKTVLPSRRRFGAVLAGAACSAQLQSAEGSTPLFNGRDLTGWTVRNGPESAFYVAEGAIAASPASAYPAWLSTEREYENFDLSCEFFLRGWIDGGIYLHAPDHGRPSTCGLKVNIFHAQDEKAQTNSMGSVFPVVAPTRANVHKTNEWNTLRIVCDWPQLRVWINGESVQDLKLDTHPELSRRLRRGYLGIVAISYPLRVRNVQIRELPGKEKLETLYEGPADLPKWFISESNKNSPVRFDAYGPVLRGDGLGHLATKEQFRDFDLQMYIRGARQHNGGVLFRSAAKGLTDPRHYEIQLHDVEEAHFPTGSLYHHKRASYPRMADEQWFLFQLLAQGPRCEVRIDGDTVLEYADLKDTEPGHIELQAHQAGRWLEFKKVRIRRL